MMKFTNSKSLILCDDSCKILWKSTYYVVSYTKKNPPSNQKMLQFLTLSTESRRHLRRHQNVVHTQKIFKIAFNVPFSSLKVQIVHSKADEIVKN